MTIALMEERPPFIECFVDSIEDREKTIKEGHYVGKDVVFFRVIPAGGKLEVVLNAEETLKNLRKKSDRFLRYYEAAYEAHMKGDEAPTTGTSVKDWPSISASDVKTLLSLNIRTVEDLATLPDDGLQRLGMGGRALQAKAAAWLTVADKTGKGAERLAALEAQFADMKAEMDRKDQELAAVKAQLAAYEGPRETVKARGGRRSSAE